MITDFYSRLKKLFTDSSLQSKLVWIYFLLIILPLGFFTFYAVHQLSALVKKQTLASVLSLIHISLRIPQLQLPS